MCSSDLTNNKRSEREIKETIPFTITTTIKIKYLGINLPEETKDLYSENCKILMTKTDEEIYHVLGLEEPTS